MSQEKHLFTHSPHEFRFSPSFDNDTGKWLPGTSSLMIPPPPFNVIVASSPSSIVPLHIPQLTFKYLSTSDISNDRTSTILGVRELQRFTIISEQKFLSTSVLYD